MFQTKVVQKIKKKNYIYPSQKPCHLWVDVEKYCEAGQATVAV